MRIQIDPAVVIANFAPFAGNPSLRESAQLFAAGKPVVEMIQAFAMNPGVLRASVGSRRCIRAEFYRSAGCSLTC